MPNYRIERYPAGQRHIVLAALKLGPAVRRLQPHGVFYEPGELRWREIEGAPR
jgi:hypothetical protein